MKTFNVGSGTVVEITESKVNISENMPGKTKYKMTIKRSSISGLVLYPGYLLICAPGLPVPDDFRTINSAVNMQHHPNCIVGPEKDLIKIYDCLNETIINKNHQAIR